MSAPLAEFELIRRYFSFAAPRPDVCLGVGDDSALLRPPPGEQLVACCDTLVAGRHFPFGTAAADIAWKALAVNLSDLAAMGAQARWFLLALTLPTAAADWLQDFAGGLRQLADQHAVQLVGGDTTRGPLSVTITALGSVPVGQALCRAAAQVGDDIYVSGYPGEAALALADILAGGDGAGLRERLDRPQPRLQLGQALRGRAHAAIDISDGLAQDLGHLLSASQVGASLDLDALPWRQERPRDLAAILQGGDDYELCFTWPPEQALPATDVALQRIGRIEARAGLRCWQGGRQVDVPQTGYQHF